MSNPVIFSYLTHNLQTDHHIYRVIGGLGFFSFHFLSILNSTEEKNSQKITANCLKRVTLFGILADGYSAWYARRFLSMCASVIEWHECVRM